MSRLTGDDLAAIEKRLLWENAPEFACYAREDIPRLLAEVRRCWDRQEHDLGNFHKENARANKAEAALASQLELEKTAWADYQACAAERDETHACLLQERAAVLAMRDALQAMEAERDRITGLLHQSNVDCLAERERARLLRGDVQLQLARTEAERDRLTLDLHSARQMVTDTHAALERSERLWQEDERLGRAREDALEARVTELEYLIADHEFEAEEYDALAGCRISICPVCGGHGGHHTHGLNQPCPWGQAAANHRAREAHAALSAREPVEGRDFESMPGVAP